MTRRYYTHYPRTVLWLVPGGVLRPEGGGPSVDIEPFYLGKTPITTRQLEAFAAGFERSPLAPGDDDPAVGVSAELAEAYADWYAEVARKPIRLPTLAEWQHACRGGVVEGTPWGDEPADDFVWHRDNAPAGRVPPLEGKRANGFGLYATLGGVWEWAADDAERVLVGGSFRSRLDTLHPASRRPATDPEAGELAGFRVARSLARG